MNNASKRGRNNKNRGKVWERKIAEVFGGKRNISDSTPHTDVESNKEQGGVVVVYTGGAGGTARAILIKEIELK